MTICEEVRGLGRFAASSTICRLACASGPSCRRCASPPDGRPGRRRRRRSRRSRPTGRWGRSTARPRPRSPTTGTTTSSWATPGTRRCRRRLPSPPIPSASCVARVAANEVAGRLGSALFLGPHNGQFWASIHCASAAVAASVGLGLDAERAAHALAVALYQPPYGMWPGFMGPTEQAADRGRAGGGRGAGGAARRRGRDRRPRRGRAPARRSRRPLLRAAPGDVRRPRQGLADRHARLQARAGLRLPAVGRRGRARRRGEAAEQVASAEIEAGWLTCEMEELGPRPRPDSGPGQLLRHADRGDRADRGAVDPGGAQSGSGWVGTSARFAPSRPRSSSATTRP